MTRWAVTATVVSILVAGASAPIVGQAAAAPSQREPALGAQPAPAVTGYALQSLPTRVVVREAHALSTLGVDGVTINAAGSSVHRPDAAMARLKRAAHAHGLAASLLVSNWSQRIGDFDRRALGRLLTNASHRAAVAARLGRIVRNGGWDGVTIDLEALRPSYADGLTAFLARVRAALPAGASIDIDVSATTRYRSRGYDLRGIARSVDRVALMAYDEHGPTWSGPGPVGSLTWQRRCLSAALDLVPAGQVDLGVAGYGYTWPRHGDGHSVKPRQARRIVAGDGATANWRPKAGEWSATLSNGTRLWWSDTRSWQQRVRLAEHRGLHGLALWRLGSADPLP